MPSTTNRSSRSGSHALVIGGSMAGILAGRVLAKHFDRVTIIEKDFFPEEPAFRKGVPQSRHLHLLVMQGQIIFEQLFPGILDELVAAGACVLDPMADVAKFNPVAGSLSRCRSHLKHLIFSRQLLDWCVHQRLAMFTNVHFLEGGTVTGLLPNSDNTGVAGVSVRIRDCSDGNSTYEEELPAELVVDASGQASKAPQWLEALGYMPPQETVVNAKLGYASRLYQRSANFQADWQAALVLLGPPTYNRGGAIFPIEGNRWIVSVIGANRDYPPTDEVGFLEFVRSLPDPIIYNTIKDGEPLTPIYGYQGTQNRLRHYDKLPRHPENFVVIGHAACAFNPIYGQGITVAALASQTLDQCLHQQRQQFSGKKLKGLARQVQKKLARVNADPWMLATSQDSRFQGAEGGKANFVTKLMHRYMDQVTRLAVQDADIHRAVVEVVHMLKPSTILFHPSILFQVLKRVFKFSSVTAVK